VKNKQILFIVERLYREPFPFVGGYEIQMRLTDTPTIEIVGFLALFLCEKSQSISKIK
jgi:hypothetical protein